MNNLPKSHPRYISLLQREKIVEGFRKGIVAPQGLIAQGRGEAFDYILGEKTTRPAKKAIKASACLFLLARHPVISVNGNAAALIGKQIIKLASAIGAKIEVNLFYRTEKRKEKIEKFLISLGAKKFLAKKTPHAIIPGLKSERRKVSQEGIFKADVVFVPLEDGDRTENLIKMGKKVVAVDLNPFSRTSQKASITVVDNVVRAVPLLIGLTRKIKNENKNKLKVSLKNYNNKKNLKETIAIIQKRLIKTSLLN